MAERSKQLIIVGYYLSRFGHFTPPKTLNEISWKKAYSKFYHKLGQDREPLQFEHSLKNTRDGYDSYFESTNREGWKDKEGNPAKLPVEAQEIFDEFKELSEEEVFEKVKLFLNEVKTTPEQFTFKNIIKENGLVFSQILINRFTASLLTKPFVILTGLSGSGKTKLAQSFAMWMSESNEQYALVPVGADWTNREPLLGYPNSLKEMHYVKPDSGVLDILIRANENYLFHEQDLSKCKPYFLILDEMNLSHVERYFADFLSTMESGDAIQLYSGVDRYTHFDDQHSPEEDSKVPKSLKLPKNLFIIGTVNIDETTYMFSPKVLDRANTIEFRISFDELEAYYKNRSPLNMEALQSKGKDESVSFMKLAAGDEISVDKKMHGKIFIEFFESLQLAGAEFGYRTANEMMELVTYFLKIGVELNDAYDYAIMQKLLPKLHGSRSKLNKVLPPLIELCQDNYPLSLEKLNRMKKNAEENGFASYAEA